MSGSSLSEINIPHIILEKTTSTIEIASKIEVDNPFFAVIAKEQLKGRGRFLDRKWVSPPDMGIYLSLLINETENLIPEGLLYITKAVALSVVDSLKQIFPEIMLKIKEPNDIFYKNGKICGVLAESKTKGNQVEKVIISFGLNLIRPEKNFEELPVATSFLSDLCGIEKAVEKKSEIINLTISNFKKNYYKLCCQKFTDIDKNFKNFLV